MTPKEDISKLKEYNGKNNLVNSDIGKKKADSQGSPVCGSRMDPKKAYFNIPELLQKVIDEDDESAWDAIVEKIDYIYSHVDLSLSFLDLETNFKEKVLSQVKLGKKLIFKPNLVGPQVIDPDTHGEDLGAPICTDWSVIAALMRWFHDELSINYNQMALAEASTTSILLSTVFSQILGKTVTSEAIFEGRSGDFYAGWGFYFVRRYLSQHHSPSHSDDPMNGYEESVAGKYLSPGKTGNKLMIYDINKLEDVARGRTVPVPGGDNYSHVTLHKVIVGGDPHDEADLNEYPGCVLINVPKLKIHAQDLITNAIKNLGIGLYPTQCPSNSPKKNSWEYALPSSETPSFKGKLPHTLWVAEIDENTNLPMMDKDGKYILKRTAGMPGTQADVIKATEKQGVFMVHISDSINMINLNHNPEGIAVRIPEGYLWSSLDCVAMDLLCARYCFKTVPMSEGIKLKDENGWITEFVHHVPVAEVDGKNIITVNGFDSPLFRYNLYSYVEDRGVGQQQYYVTGWDSLTDSPLASLDGHLGRIENGNFIELMTKTMYYNPSCMLWDMQKTILSYAESHDSLTGSKLLKAFMDGFDENGDGIIDYDENGKKGIWTSGFSILAHALDIQITDSYGDLKSFFYQLANFTLKNSHENWNSQGHNFTEEYLLMWIATLAYDMSRSDTVNKDTFVKGMKWGKGMWPSWDLVEQTFFTNILYGAQSLDQISLNSLYGTVFTYADKTGNNGSYTGLETEADPDSINKYFRAIYAGEDPLNFSLYVPKGFGTIGNSKIPNVEETDDPNKIFTAHFNHGQEIW